MWSLWDWSYNDARPSKPGSRHLIFAVICCIGGVTAVLVFSCNGGLICIKKARGTIFRFFNIANRFLHIFPHRTTSIRNWFPGGARRPPLPTVLYGELGVFCGGSSWWGRYTWCCGADMHRPDIWIGIRHLLPLPMTSPPSCCSSWLVRRWFSGGRRFLESTARRARALRLRVVISSWLLLLLAHGLSRKSCDGIPLLFSLYHFFHCSAHSYTYSVGAIWHLRFHSHYTRCSSIVVEFGSVLCRRPPIPDYGWEPSWRRR